MDDSSTEEERKGIQLREVLCDNRLLSLLNEFDSNGSNEITVDYTGKLRQQFGEILDFDHDSLVKTEQQLKELEKADQKIQRSFKETQANRIQTEHIIDTLNKDISDTHEQLLICQDKLPELCEDIKQLRADNDLISPAIKKIEPIAKSISTKELHKKKKRIQDLKDTLLRNRQFYEKLNNIREERLIDYTALHSEVQSEVEKWNLFVLNMPEEMSGLQLRQTRIRPEAFIKEIHEIMQKKSDIESRIEMRLVKEKADDFETKREIISKKNMLKVFTKEVNDLSDDMVVLQLDWEDLTNKAHQLSEELRDHRKRHVHEYEELRKLFVKDLEMLEKIETARQKELAENIKSIEEVEEKGTAYFIEFHNICVDDIAKMYECIEDIKRKKYKYLDEAQRKMAQQIYVMEEVSKLYSRYKEVVNSNEN